MTREDLQHGLEWVSGKTKITVQYSGGYLDVFLYPDYPNEQRSICLYLGIIGNRVSVTDLVGNGYQSGFQSDGYGTLIFNIGIQALYAFFGVKPSDQEAKEIRVTGKVSSVGDPGDEPERSKCGNRRNSFWASFGFLIKEPNNFDTTMKARLSDLHLKVGGLTTNGTPRTVTLEEFWLKGEAPKLLTLDLEALMAADLEQFQLDQCPTEEMLEAQWDKAISHSRGIRRSLWLLMVSVCAYIAFISFRPLDAISVSCGAVFVSFLLSSYIDNRIWNLLPSYRRYRDLREKRCEIITNIKDYIQELESSHNGLIWRLHRGLKEVDSSLADDIFTEMAEDSKKQYAFKLSDCYENYGRFVELAKAAIVGNSLLPINYEI